MEAPEQEVESGPVLWRDLRAHALREALFIVGDGVDLRDAAAAIARDDTVQVAGWIQAGILVRPTVEQLEAWDEEPDKAFVASIVQPFVLAKAITGLQTNIE